MAGHFAEPGSGDPFFNDLDYWKDTHLTAEQIANLTNAGNILAGSSARPLGDRPNGTNAYSYNAYAAGIMESKMAANDVMLEARHPGQPLIALARAVASGAVFHATVIGPVYGPNPNHISMPHARPE